MKSGRILGLAGWRMAGCLLAVTMIVTGARAQDYPPGPNGEAAPVSSGPQPDVARISLIHGDVSTQRGDTGDWAVTTVNAPLVRGDQVATGDKSRAEIQLDYADIVRLAARSQVKIADLSRTRIQLQVAQGYANFTQLKGSEAEVEIDSPNVAVRPLKRGRYRVQVNSDSETDVIVREGEAEVTTPQGSTRVKEGEIITIRGTDNPEYRVSEAPVRDDWDRWNKDRDNTIQDSQSWGRTNRYYTGVHDLDGYGQWIFVPGYGWVWKPYYTSATWAPYQSGRWVWEPYYGWTWVSYEPWGWAPYHYGRWFFYGGNWCWWPGPVAVGYRPVWSPAFVFFVGFGRHATFGFGSIGWFPVGPFDPYYPWYGRGFSRVSIVNVNVINVHRGPFIGPLGVRGRQPYFSNVGLIRTNARVRGSITSVGVEDFGHGNFANRRYGVEEHEWREARVMTANLPVVPSRENLRVSGNGTLPATVQPRNVDRFYARRQPPAAPEPFHTQVERVQRAVGPQAVGAHSGVNERGGPVSDGASAAVRENNGRFGNNAGAGPGHAGANEGMARNNPPGNSGANTPGANDRGSWRPFGSPGQGASGSPRQGTGVTAGNGRPEAGPSAARSNDQGRVPRTDSAEPRRGGNESATWQRFPSSGERTAAVPQGGQQPERGTGPAATQTPSPRTQDDHGGWQRFPGNGNGGRSNDSSVNRNDSGGGSKPPLELHRPIVTPRMDTRDTRTDTRDTRSDTPRSAPPSREEPRYSPPSRSEPGYSPPSRSESPRYSPPSRSEAHGGGPSSRGSSSRGSSSQRSGSQRSGERGGSHESKSSGPKR